MKPNWDTQETHKCSKCGEVKPISEFYNQISRGHKRHHSECKDCTDKLNNRNRIIYIERNTAEYIAQLENSDLSKKCNLCGIIKPIKEFNVNRDSPDAHNDYCIECSKTDKKIKYQNHKELSPEEYRKWRIEQNEERRVEKRKLKTEVFTHYCPNGILKCANPFHIHAEDITDLDILTLDHIDGKGYEDRKKNGNRVGHVLYRQLKNSGYPSNFQILCCNCQMKKKFINHEYGGRFMENNPHLSQNST